MASVVNATQAHYRRFSIPKRRGGKRQIDAPYPLLLDCQRWINRHILMSIPVHPAATAYVKDMSLLANVQPHLAQKCLFRIDLRDFFPSISTRRIVAQFRRVGYAKNVAFYLAALCCLNGRLPQGAATSPALSNLVSVRMDRRLASLSTRADLTYTRYADDLSFSGEYIGSQFRRSVCRIIEECGFIINEEKNLPFCKTRSENNYGNLRRE